MNKKLWGWGSETLRQARLHISIFVFSGRQGKDRFNVLISWVFFLRLKLFFQGELVYHLCNKNMYIIQKIRVSIYFTGTQELMALVDNTSKSFILLEIDSKTTPRVCRVFNDDGDEEELEIDAIAITNENNHVIVSSWLRNDLLFFSTRTLEKTRVIKGRYIYIYIY